MEAVQTETGMSKFWKFIMVSMFGFFSVYQAALSISKFGTEWGATHGALALIFITQAVMIAERKSDERD